MTARITDAMLNGQVDYGDTFIDGRQFNQKSIERRLIEGARFYTGTKSSEFIQGYLAANKIVKDGFAPRPKDGY